LPKDSPPHLYSKKDAVSNSKKRKRTRKWQARDKENASKTSPTQTDDPMRATEGGETQAAAAISTTEATEKEEEEEEEEEATTPLIIICSVPSRYYYTHHHHRRARDFLVSQFRWLLPMRAKHGKQPI
jgi:hypothetical protein